MKPELKRREIRREVIKMRNKLLSGLNFERKEVKMMKRIVLLTVLVAGLLFTISPVFAFSLGGYLGPAEFKFFDWTIGRSYQLDQNGVWVSEGARAGLPGGNQNIPDGVIVLGDGVEDSWSLITVTTINDNDGNPLWNANPLTEQITGHMYGFDDVYISSVGMFNIDVGSTGGILELYLDNMTAGGTVFTSVPSPYVNARPPIGGGGDAWNATDGVLFLKLQAVFGIVPTDPSGQITRYENVTGLTSPYQGTGAMYWDVIGGNYAQLFDSNGFPVPFGNADMYSIFNFNPFGRNQFDSKSSDPTYTNVVPEPTTVLLVGSGLVAVGWYARRRTKKQS
jgi:hypothetical protein